MTKTDQIIVSLGAIAAAHGVPMTLAQAILRDELSGPTELACALHRYQAGVDGAGPVVEAWLLAIDEE